MMKPFHSRLELSRDVYSEIYSKKDVFKYIKNTYLYLYSSFFSNNRSISISIRILSKKLEKIHSLLKFKIEF